MTQMYSKLVDTTKSLQEKREEVERLKFDLNQVRFSTIINVSCSQLMVAFSLCVCFIERRRSNLYFFDNVE